MPRKKRLPPEQSVLPLTGAQAGTAEQPAHQSIPSPTQPKVQAPAQPLDVDRLVSLTFDSNPNVRRQTAQTLGTIDDPRAIFALIELSSDKDPAVQEAARAALDRFKGQKEEQEAIVSIEQLLAERKVAKMEDPQAAAVEAKQKLLPSLEKLFHHDGKSPKGAREKMMSSLLEKFFLPKAQGDQKDPLSSIEHVHGGEQAAASAHVQQEHKDALTRDEVDQIRLGHEEPKKQPTAQPVEEEEQMQLPAQQHEDAAEEYAQQAQPAMPEKPFYYKLAYDIAKTAGAKKNVVLREEKRIIANLKKDVELAFKLALSAVEEEGIPTLSNLKPGLKRISLAPMQIVSISQMQLGKKGAYAKIMLTDGKKNVPLLVPVERAHGISASDQIILKDAQTDYLVETSELAIVLSPHSKMLIVR